MDLEECMAFEPEYPEQGWIKAVILKHCPEDKTVLVHFKGWNKCFDRKLSIDYIKSFEVFENDRKNGVHYPSCMKYDKQQLLLHLNHVTKSIEDSSKTMNSLLEKIQKAQQEIQLLAQQNEELKNMFTQNEVFEQENSKKQDEENSQKNEEDNSCREHPSKKQKCQDSSSTGETSSYCTPKEIQVNGLIKKLEQVATTSDISSPKYFFDTIKTCLLKRENKEIPALCRLMATGLKRDYIKGEITSGKMNGQQFFTLALENKMADPEELQRRKNESEQRKQWFILPN